MNNRNEKRVADMTRGELRETITIAVFLALLGIVLLSACSGVFLAVAQH